MPKFFVYCFGVHFRVYWEQIMSNLLHGIPVCGVLVVLRSPIVTYETNVQEIYIGPSSRAI